MIRFYSFYTWPFISFQSFRIKSSTMSTNFMAILYILDNKFVLGALIPSFDNVLSMILHVNLKCCLLVFALPSLPGGGVAERVNDPFIYLFIFVCVLLCFV